MRFAASLLVWLTVTAPAAARVCEASVTEAGEVIATLDGGKAGAALVAWSWSAGRACLKN